MDNIVKYLWSEQRTFSEKPLGPLDSLVLSTLSYFNLEVYSDEPITYATSLLLHDVVSLTDWERLSETSWLKDAKDMQAFMRAVMASRRYRGVRFKYYANETSDIVEKQFCAVSCLLDDGSSYLSFRGTDGTLSGWKEDFNLCFKRVIPSQTSALAYTSGVASATTGDLYLGGHSKGGNLAEYAALCVDESVYKRIKGVFNHDGPSFLEDPSPRIDDAAFQAILHKTVPESSAFGMILEHRNDYRVVQSSATGLFQHEPFSWLVDGSDFLYQGDLNSSAKFFDSALDEWLRSKTPEERELFIDTIYNLFVTMNITRWGEFKESIVSNSIQLLDNSSKLDQETRGFILQTFGALAKILKDKTVDALTPNPRIWMTSIRNKNE